MGAVKAGVQVVTFVEKESHHSLDHALEHTQAKGLIFSPNSTVGENVTRKDFV